MGQHDSSRIYEIGKGQHEIDTKLKNLRVSTSKISSELGSLVKIVSDVATSVNEIMERTESMKSIKKEGDDETALKIYELVVAECETQIQASTAISGVTGEKVFFLSETILVNIGDRIDILEHKISEIEKGPWRNYHDRDRDLCSLRETVGEMVEMFKLIVDNGEYDC